MTTPIRTDHLNEEESLKRFGGDRGLLRELYNAFLLDEPNKRRALEEARTSGVAAETARAAHALKGAAATISAFRCRELAAQLEAAGRSEDQAAMSRLYPQVIQAMDSLCGLLKE